VSPTISCAECSQEKSVVFHNRVIVNRSRSPSFCHADLCSFERATSSPFVAIESICQSELAFLFADRLLRSQWRSDSYRVSMSTPISTAFVPMLTLRTNRSSVWYLYKLTRVFALEGSGVLPSQNAGKLSKVRSPVGYGEPNHPKEGRRARAWADQAAS
jgi:hypothetical protein